MEKVFRILLVDDNAGDVELTQEALRRGKLLNEIQVAGDGMEAMAILRHEPPFAHAPRPDLILLDLHLPKKDGKQVLTEIKTDPNLRSIPVVILTSSDMNEDILQMYDLHANGYINKPVDFKQFLVTIQKLNTFWMSVAILPGSHRE